MTTRPSWLQLLLGNASVDELDAHRRALPPAPEVESEALRAIQIQSRLRDRSQRAASLAALSEIASRLTSTRDLPELLTDIAVQARHLLRTDVTYLALLEDEALRIRYVDGAVGPSAREIRLPTTAGLAGQILETGRPASVSDYLTDQSIRHQPHVDSFAAEEGLRSLLGVPLRARGTTLGVLFAAERAVRPFTNDESRLLVGLANHAAVAIENARLLDAERASAAAVQAANRLLRQHATATDKAIALHERLTEAAVRGGGPAAVVRALSEVLGLPVQLVDAADRPVAGPDLGAPFPSGQMPADGCRTVLQEFAGGAVRILCPVVAAEDYLGCLVVRGEGHTGDAELRLLERGALGIALSLVQQKAIADAATRSRQELLTALIEGGDDPEMLERRAAGMGVDLAGPQVLAVAQPDDAAARAACTELVRRSDGLLAERSGRTVVLLPASAEVAVLASQATVGVSPVVSGARELPEAYASARRCLQAALALGRRHVVASTESLGVYGFLLSSSGPREASEFVQRTVGPLLRHDAARSSELARTLEEYLANGRQHTAAADSLHIHPNTLYQRLARVSSVLGDAWREPDRALDILVALRLHRLAAAL